MKLSDLEAERSPLDDSDADEDYIQLSEEEASEVSDHDPEDHDLQSPILSNKSVHEKQKELMRKLVLEHKEQAKVIRRSLCRKSGKCPKS